LVGKSTGISAELATTNSPDAGTDGALTGETSAAACFFDFVDCGLTGRTRPTTGTQGDLGVEPRGAPGVREPVDEVPGLVDDVG
jgi:hypothetical protein